MRVGSAVTLSALLVATTGQILNLPVVDELVGSIVNSFSQYLDYNGPKGAVPGRGPVVPKTTSDTAYWLADIAHHGYAAFNPNASTYQVFRNVKDFGAKGSYSLYFLPLQPLRHTQVTVLRTIQQPSMRLSAVVVGLGRLVVRLPPLLPRLSTFLLEPM
jgi:hypothetical protein